MKNILILFVSILFICSCAKGASNSESGREKERDTIEMPEIPSDLRDPTARADYLITHFWDKLDIKDTDKSHDRTLMEQSLVNFLSILPYASNDSVIKNGFAILLERTWEDQYVYKFLKDTARAYLSDADSPMVSDNQYLLFMEAQLETDHLTSSERLRLEDMVEMVSKNKTGTKATDFTFIMPDGKSSSLYQTLVPGKNMLLIFFDPDCELCEEVIDKLKTDRKIERGISEGNLQILAVYAGDKEKSWRRKASAMPDSWTVGINKSEIEENDLYYLPGMPTIYLLDGEGTVKEKDISIDKLLNVY